VTCARLSDDAGFLRALRLSGDLVATSGDASDLRRGGFGPVNRLRPWVAWAGLAAPRIHPWSGPPSGSRRLQDGGSPRVAGDLQSPRDEQRNVTHCGNSDLRHGGLGPVKDRRPRLGWEAAAGKFVSEEDEGVTGAVTCRGNERSDDFTGCAARAG
jgi:hypothetical protein